MTKDEAKEGGKREREQRTKAGSVVRRVRQQKAQRLTRSGVEGRRKECPEDRGRDGGDGEGKTRLKGSGWADGEERERERESERG